MKILLLTKWDAKGGISTHVARLIEHSKNEFEVITYPRFIGLPYFRAFSFILAGFFRGMLKDFEIIHAHYAVPQGLLGLLLKYAKRRPLVITVHGSDMTVLAKSPVFGPVLRFTLYKADRIIAVSEFLKDRVESIGVPKEKVEVIYGGTPMPENGGPFDFAGRVVLFIGNLVPQKGVDTLISAFKKIDIDDLGLFIVGSGPEGQRLKAMSNGLDNIKFLGMRNGLKEILTKSDVLVLPSREEGFGLVLLEAMALGTPVVATNTGGIPEIVENGASGILVEKESSSELADAIVRVLEDEDLRKTLIENGKNRAKRFTWEKMGVEVDRLYESTCARA